ncbi:hypothetical protein GGR56DRAFT_610013 [Xylariaceae sp. FL0804]|nr:hypothetical protein GGR56DRAFT_610013 [Xylariaceae sp. FL0804]
MSDVTCSVAAVAVAAAAAMAALVTVAAMAALAAQSIAVKAFNHLLAARQQIEMAGFGSLRSFFLVSPAALWL